MKVVIVSTTDKKSGAARAAFRLHRGLVSIGQNSVMLVKHKYSDDPGVVQAVDREAGDAAESLIFGTMHQMAIHQNRTAGSNSRFSLPYPGYDISGVDLVKSAAVINLHWINDFQSIETIAELLALGTPVVWTLHDQWPFTGGCHYSAGCQGYVHECRDCPQLKKGKYDITAAVLQSKIDTFSKTNLTIVCPSLWMAECAKKSRVFGSFRIEVVPNSLETDVFKPASGKRAKRSLGINPEALVLLFGADATMAARKGFPLLEKSLEFCAQDVRFVTLAKNGRLHFVTFGKIDAATFPGFNLDIPVTHLGDIDSDKKLAEVYSAADIFLLPSLEDNLPNTMLESMACGTPVAAFETGGMPDVVQNGVTGFMAPVAMADKLGAGILELAFDEHRRSQMRLRCRQLIEDRFQLSHQAERYRELFSGLAATGNPLSKARLSAARPETNAQVRPAHAEPKLASICNDLYRTAAFKIIKQQMAELAQSDRHIAGIYNSSSYRIGHVILFPFKLIIKIIRFFFGQKAETDRN